LLAGRLPAEQLRALPGLFGDRAHASAGAACRRDAHATDAARPGLAREPAVRLLWRSLHAPALRSTLCDVGPYPTNAVARATDRHRGRLLHRSAVGEGTGLCEHGIAGF